MSHIAATVRARMRGVAKAQGVDFNQVPARLAPECIPYRLTQSRYADRCSHEGPHYFTAWYYMPHRAARNGEALTAIMEPLRASLEPIWVQPN